MLLVCRHIDSRSGVKIVGGEPTAASQDKRPLYSTVQLEYIGTSPDNPGGYCTGTVIGPHHIVTAAHCLHAFGPPEIYLASNRQKLTPTGFTIHPMWGKEPNFAHDIGVISFSQVSDPKENSVGEGIIIPAQIASPEKLQVGTEILLAGFGEMEQGKSVLNQLYQVKTKVAQINPTMKIFDIESGSGKGPCHGDSGGPAYLDENGLLLLVGATSHNVKGKCDSGEGTYTDVTRYLSWIRCAFAEQKIAFGNPVESEDCLDPK